MNGSIVYKVIIIVSLVLVIAGCFGMANLFDSSSDQDVNLNNDNDISTIVYYMYSNTNYVVHGEYTANDGQDSMEMNG